MHSHTIRTGQAASRRLISFHMLVPGQWTVRRGHGLLERIETDLRDRWPDVTLLTHLEPSEDPRALPDTELL